MASYFLGLLAQWYSIDIMTMSSEFSWKTFGMHMSALIETVLSACLSLLIHEPYGLLSLQSCSVEQLSDWYYSQLKIFTYETNFKKCYS